MTFTLHSFYIANGNDNVNYILRDEISGVVAVIDPTDAELTIAELKTLGWDADLILCTHHHWDHVDGIADVVKHSGCRVYGYGPDARRIPHITHTVEQGENVQVGAMSAEVLFLPGHTKGHIAYYFAEQKLLFSGDVLFAMGCGRLFEGTPEQMYDSLQQLKALPEDVLVCSAHEYTLTNAEFTESLVLGGIAINTRIVEVKKLRAENKATVPMLLGVEKASNPFLLASSVEEFSSRRALRDRW